MPQIAPISYRKLAKVFELDGFKLDRQKGSHLIYVKEGIPRPVIIPMYDRIPVFVVKNNLRTAKISRERYFELLGKI